MMLPKKDIMKIIKSVSQKLREKGDDASKVVHQLECRKEKYLDILSQLFELSQDQISELKNIYPSIPDEVLTRKIKMMASDQLLKVMTADLADLLTAQLSNNASEIKEDKHHLERAITALEALSASLDEVVNHMIAEHLLRGKVQSYL